MIEPLDDHPAHGGQLDIYAVHYGIAKEQWLDLSTGINPNSYPNIHLPDDVFRDLPNEHDGLVQAAVEYYGSDELLMVPGSSWAIQHLPGTLEKLDLNIKTALLPRVGYKEHEYAWRILGANIIFYDAYPTDDQLKRCDVCVLINPNNPDAHLYTQVEVLHLAHVLKEQKGLLIIDEAFMDASPEFSTIPVRLDNMVIFRSLGKFFGLAGLRVGCVIANKEILTQLKQQQEPWAISHPARYIAKCALADKLWIKGAQNKLIEQGDKLKALCNLVFLEIKNINIRSTRLFVTIFFNEQALAVQCHHLLCEQGVLTRLLDEKNSIRLGLPKDTQNNWQRLQDALKNLVVNLK